MRELRLFASTTEVKTDAESRAVVALKKDESGTYSFYYTPAEAGEYNIWICSDSNGEDVVEIGRAHV